tara:strand:+ start:11180 stop:11299 length:120 start_codon:yes stop_codon:yes gene_type:complete
MRPPYKVWSYLANALASVMFVLGAAHVTTAHVTQTDRSA